jgi:hypothetical protein
LSNESADSPAPRHRKSFGSLLLELVMIGIGVFLGASAEQWRDSRHQETLARASLQNFRHEIANNRAQIAAVRVYHDSLGNNTLAFLNTEGPRGLREFMQSVRYHGMTPPELEHTAWDLALATQALSDIDPTLAFAISHVYSIQQSFVLMQTSFMGNALTPTTFANVANATPLAIAMSSYLEDVNIQEPRLIHLYDKLLPLIDSALGGPPATDSVTKKKDSAAAKK